MPPPTGSRLATPSDSRLAPLGCRMLPTSLPRVTDSPLRVRGTEFPTRPAKPGPSSDLDDYKLHGIRLRAGLQLTTVMKRQLREFLLELQARQAEGTDV